MFELCWQQHGGSGLLLDWSSALELAVSERDALLRRIRDRREAESKAIRGASRGDT